MAEEVERAQEHDEIIPDRLYGVHDVARLLNPDKPLHPDTVYRIPESLLRKTRVGPRRGLTKWRGRDILRYLDGEEAAA